MRRRTNKLCYSGQNKNMIMKDRRFTTDGQDLLFRKEDQWIKVRMICLLGSCRHAAILCWFVRFYSLQSWNRSKKL